MPGVGLYVGAILLLLISAVTAGIVLYLGPAPFVPPAREPALILGVATTKGTPVSTPEHLPTPTPATIPIPQPTLAPSPTPVIYKVQAGDTLSKIAEKFGTTATAIAEANRLEVMDRLQIDQELTIPR
ncbi:MAG: LysM peptidoglycan-binding domain-containing protein [Chloroflexi bacterium]|nr:LysM peptidoglycan-binding domain-containing protein [Chloroflexota bacterium]